MTPVFMENLQVSDISRAVKIYTKKTEGIYFKPRLVHGFVYYLAGECDYVYPDASFTARENMFLYLPKGVRYEIHPRTDCRCILIDFDGAAAAKTRAFGKLYPDLKFSTARNHEQVLNYWDKIGTPSDKHRWCCSVMKTAPLYRTLKVPGTNRQAKVLVFDGVRAEESTRRSTYFP